MGTNIWSLMCTLFLLHRTGGGRLGSAASGCSEAGVTVPQNAHVLTVVPGKFVLLDCDKGYHYLSRSEGVLWCENNTWVSHEDSGRCRKIDCGYPPSIENSRYEAFETSYNSSALYFCDNGYSLYGDTTLVCDQEGHWNGTRPYCHSDTKGNDSSESLSTIGTIIQHSSGTTQEYNPSAISITAENKTQVALSTMYRSTAAESVVYPSSTTSSFDGSVHSQQNASDINSAHGSSTAPPQRPGNSFTDTSTVSVPKGTTTSSTIQVTSDQWGKYISTNTNRSWTEGIINITKATTKITDTPEVLSTRVLSRGQQLLPFTEVVNFTAWLTSTQNTTENTTANITEILGASSFVPSHILSDMGQLEVVAGICIGLLILSLVFIAIVIVLRKRKHDEGGRHRSKKPTLYNRMTDESATSSRDRICSADYVTDLESGNSLERYKSITVQDLNNIDEFVENELEDYYDGARITVPSIKNINLLPTILEECSASTSETSLTESFHDLHRNNHDPSHGYVPHGVIQGWAHVQMAVAPSGISVALAV